MKKVIRLLLIVLLMIPLMFFSACGDDEETPPSSSSQQEQPSPGTPSESEDPEDPEGPGEPEVKQYTIKWDLGYNSNITSDVVNEGSSVSKPQDPTRDGYTFEGWFVPKTGVGLVEQTFPFVASRNVTISAKWRVITYTITYNLPFAFNPMFRSYCVETSTTSLPVATTTSANMGYTFEGWYEDEDYLIPATEVRKGSTGNKVFYGKTSVINYTISYTLNDGINHPDNPASYTAIGGNITLLNPTRDGYAFDGWFTKADFSGTPLSILYASRRANVSLYAKWSLATYTIQYFLICCQRCNYYLTR